MIDVIVWLNVSNRSRCGIGVLYVSVLLYFLPSGRSLCPIGNHRTLKHATLNIIDDILYVF